MEASEDFVKTNKDKGHLFVPPKIMDLFFKQEKPKHKEFAVYIMYCYKALEVDSSSVNLSVVDASKKLKWSHTVVYHHYHNLIKMGLMVRYGKLTHIIHLIN